MALVHLDLKERQEMQDMADQVLSLINNWLPK